LPVSPVPADAPDVDVAAKRFYAKLAGDRDQWRFDYRGMTGRWLFSVYRFETESGKEIRPISFWRDPKTGESAWSPKWPASPLPLYGLEELAQHPDLPVLLVEGELKRERAYEVLGDSFVVLSLASGAKAIDKIDLAPIANRHVACFPDNDRAGCEAMAAVARKLEAGQAARAGGVTDSVDVIRPDPAWPKSHDVADLIGEGWGAIQLHRMSNSTRLALMRLKRTCESVSPPKCRARKIV
jgi:putative DNA primase/helicase